MDNLRNAFPDADENSLVAIMHGAFRNVGISLFEFLCFPRFTSALINSMISITNRDFVRELYSRGNGLILLTAHFGNWELMAQSVPVCAGIPVHIIVKPQANTYVDRRITAWRSKFGNLMVPMESSVRELLRSLREKKAIGIVVDQTASKESLFVPFFGREVPTFEGPAMFSLKTGAPLIIGVAVRQADGKYQAQFSEVPASDLKGYTKENVITLTKRHVAMTEAIIRKYPEQWMWMHKRWKHVPSRVEEQGAKAST
jgi:Kdo2-lipid IVA lauroyltransferase/acyltransferase